MRVPSTSSNVRTIFPQILYPGQSARNCSPQTSKKVHEFGYRYRYRRYALVGALKDNDAAEKAGAVYVFTRSNGDTWTQASAKLYASDANKGDFFGSCVSLFENAL